MVELAAGAEEISATVEMFHSAHVSRSTVSSTPRARLYLVPR